VPPGRRRFNKNCRQAIPCSGILVRFEAAGFAEGQDPTEGQDSIEGPSETAQPLEQTAQGVRKKVDT